MNAKQFYDKVVEMRRAQKNFFATTDEVAKKQWLNESKKLEKEIDAEIERVNNLLTQPELGL